VTEKVFNLQEVLDGCLRNDRRCQRRLYDEYAPRVFGLCQRFARSKEDAEEILMDGFMNIFKNIHTYRRESNFFTWVHKVFLNTSINHYRARSRYRHETMPDSPEWEEGHLEDEKIVSSLEAKDILKLVQGLSDLQRMVFNLKVVEGYSYSEIAEQLNENENAVRAVFFRARKTLQNALKTDMR